MGALVFEKYEGLGNDFLVVVAASSRAGAVARDGGAGFLSPAEVARVCDRNRGVGGDGVLELRLPSAGSPNARMIVHNADGSVPEMCGNGLRCVALALVRSHGFARGVPLVVDTDAGLRICEVIASSASAGSESLVRAEVGPATVLGAREISLPGRTFVLHEATTGNPHAVWFGEIADEEIERFGPLLATHASFPNGANIGFARLRPGVPNAIDLVVWERGVGRTLACGTGATAAAAIAGARGWVDAKEPVMVALPGGELSLRISDAASSVQMTGPARFVFDGRYELAYEARGGAS